MTEQPRGIISDKIIDGILADCRLNEAGFKMPAPHCHPYFELFYVESGACSFFVDNNVYDLGEGDFLLIPPQVFHYTRYPAGACKRNNIFFRAEHIDARVRALMPQGESFFAEPRIFQTPEGFREQITGLLARMFKEERIADGRSEIMLETLLCQLLLLCGRECHFVNDLPDDIHTTDRQIVAAAKFISERYMDDITAADIACAAGYSPNYLSKKFRETTGTGVHEYLLFTRLQRAALELILTDRSITDIAAGCGFSDGNYFKDAFKKKYGVTPRAYRKRPPEHIV